MHGNSSNSAGSAQADTITIARSTNNWAVASKAFRREQDGSFSQLTSYRAGKLFNWEVRPVTGIDDLFVTLRDVSRDSKAFVMRGEPLDPNGRAQLRRSQDRTSDDGTFEAATFSERPRSWGVFDFDKVPAPPGRDARDLSFDEIAGIARALLPPEFTDGDLVVQLTSSHGLKPDALRFRIWVWLSRPLGRIELENWLDGVPDDKSMYRTVQAIYIAAPTFENGSDPTPERWALVRSPFSDKTGTVHVPAIIDPPVKAPAGGATTGKPGAVAGRRVSARVRGAWRLVLDTAGDGPGQDGFFRPATSAAGVWAMDPDADPAEFLTELDRLLRERGAARGEAYRQQRLNDARGWLAELQARERAKREPVPCAPPSGLVPVDLTTAGQAVDRAVGTLFDEAEKWVQETVRHTCGGAAIQEAVDAGDRARADRSADELGLPAFDPKNPDSGGGNRLGPIWARLPHEPADPPKHGVKVTVGVGKTESVVTALGRVLAPVTVPGVPFVYQPRVAFVVKSHRLAADLARRLRAAYGSAVSVAVWRGLDAEDQSAPGETMCRRNDEVGKVRRAGGDVSDVCGGKGRGYCRFHSVCGYQRQIAGAAGAQVVIFAGNGLLAKAPPEATRRPKVTVPGVTDPLKLPDFDVVVIDEPTTDQLFKGRDGEPYARLAVNELRDPNALDPTTGRTKGEQDALRAAQTEFRALLPALALELDAAAAALKGGAGRASMFLTYGALRRAFGGRSDLAIEALARDLARLALKAKVNLKFDPASDWPTFEAASGAVIRSNRIAMGLWRLMEAIETSFRVQAGAADGDPAVFLEVGEIDDGKGGKEPGVIVRAVENIDEAWRVPTLILDATMRSKILERWWPDLVVTADVVVLPDPAAVRVVQTYMGSPGYKSIKDSIQNGGQLVADIAALIEVSAARYRDEAGVSQPNGSLLLVVCPKILEEALLARWNGTPPVGVELAHFGNIRGLDTWSGVRAIMVISRPLPPSGAVEDQAGLMDGRWAPPTGYERQDARWLMSDGTGRRLSEALDRHRHELTEEMRASKCDDELEQAIGRARAVRRTASNPLDVFILTNVPTSIPVDELVKFDDLLSIGDVGPLGIAAARGVHIDPSRKGAWEAVALLTGGLLRDAARMAQARSEMRSRERSPYRDPYYKGIVRVSAHQAPPTEHTSGPQEDALEQPGPETGAAPVPQSPAPAPPPAAVGGRPGIDVRLKNSKGRCSVLATIDADNLPDAEAVVRRALKMAGQNEDTFEVLPATAKKRPKPRTRPTVASTEVSASTVAAVTLDPSADKDTATPATVNQSDAPVVTLDTSSPDSPNDVVQPSPPPPAPDTTHPVAAVTVDQPTAPTVIVDTVPPAETDAPETVPASAGPAEATEASQPPASVEGAGVPLTPPKAPERTVILSLDDLRPLGDRLNLAKPTVRKVLDRNRPVERRHGKDEAVRRAITELIGEAVERRTAPPEVIRAMVVSMAP